MANMWGVAIGGANESLRLLCSSWRGGHARGYGRRIGQVPCYGSGIVVGDAQGLWPECWHAADAKDRINPQWARLVLQEPVCEWRLRPQQRSNFGAVPWGM